MTDAERIAAAWPDWETVREIGQGAFSTVYEVRNSRFPELRAAVKIIRVPPEEEDVRALRADGFNEEEIRSFVDGLARETMSEIQVMKRYQGMSHFVSMEDCKLLPEENGCQAQYILIRMELLKSLTEFTSDKTLNEDEVIGLGLQLCQALSVCHADGVLHRDVKPGNIFVNDRSPEGVLYKLGDFGASRLQETGTAAMSVKGSMVYMAPEVVTGQKYDGRADLYSLGLTLYRLMNGNRMPFLPARNLFTHEEYAVANRMRLMGTPLPPAANASDRLNAVLRKACAGNPDGRYRTAGEMAAALRAVQTGAEPAAKRPSRFRPGRVLAAAAAAALLAVPLLLRPWEKQPAPPAEATPLPMLNVSVSPPAEAAGCYGALKDAFLEMRKNFLTVPEATADQAALLILPARIAALAPKLTLDREKMLLTLHEPPSRWVAVLTDKEGRAWGGTYRRETDSFRFSDGRGGQAETAETVQLSTHFPLEDWLLKLICTYQMGETPSVQALELIQSSRAGGAPAFHWLAEKGDTWHCRFYLMNDEPVVWTEYEQPTGENVQ